MAETLILKELKGEIGYITINRPEALNCFNKPALDALEEILLEWKEDEKCRALIITGAGLKAFSAGADVGTFIEEVAKPLGGREWSRYGQAVFNIFDSLGKPSIAAVNGVAVGGGFELALACTFRIASQKARFGFTEIARGFLPGWGGTSRITRLLGKAKTAELILTGELLSAEAAMATGVVTRVVPPEELMAACEELAGKIVKNSPIAVRVALEAIHHAQYLSLEESLILESNLGGLACCSEDAKEGLKAFLEKRNAVFKGR